MNGRWDSGFYPPSPAHDRLIDADADADADDDHGRYSRRVGQDRVYHSPTMKTKSMLLRATAGAAILLQPCLCDAQAVQPREALEDTRLYFTAPLRWDGHDWLEFGSTLVAIGVVHEFDDDVRDHFADDSAPLDGDDPDNLDDALPAAVMLAGTWLLAGIVDQPDAWREVGSMIEATAFTAVSSEILKLSLGRQRPNETTDPDQWFESGDSFPSRHVGVAFAIGTVLAESGDDRYRWARRFLGYGLAGATAYLRMDHNQHWASDVAAGAALGLSTARFVMNRREAGADKPSFAIAPGDAGGVMFTFHMPLH